MRRQLLTIFVALFAIGLFVETSSAQSPWRRLFNRDKSNQPSKQQSSDDDDYQRRLDQYRRSDQYQRYEPPPPAPEVIEIGAGVMLDGGGGVQPTPKEVPLNPAGNSRVTIQPTQRSFDPNFSGAATPRGGSGNFEGGSSRTSVVAGRARLETDEGSRHIVIEKHLKTGAIHMEITQFFGPEDMDRLKSQYPELTDYVDVFPDSIDGAKLELGISLTRTIDARSAAELEKKDPGSFNLYRRYENDLTSAPPQFSGQQTTSSNAPDYVPTPNNDGPLVKRAWDPSRQIPKINGGGGGGQKRQ